MAVKEQERTDFVEAASSFQKRFSDRDQLILEGLIAGEPLAEIGYAVGLTKERIRQLAEKWDVHEQWKDSNVGFRHQRSLVDPKKVRNQALDNLVRSLTDVLSKRSRKEGWAYEQAMKYFMITTSYRNFDDYLNLFKMYEDAKARGERVSLMEFDERTGFDFSLISRMFKRLDISPMYRRLKVRRFTQEHKEAINRSVDIPMSITDIAYFLDARKHVVASRFSRTGKERPEHEPFIQTFGKKNKLNYRKASEIYEAQDLGFNNAEIAELLDSKQELVDFALLHRQSISIYIINAFKTMYQREDINRPYLTKDQRQILLSPQKAS